MRILITCRELSTRAGSQLYTRDVAIALKRLGHDPIVFSPVLGEIASEIRTEGIPAISRLDQLGAPPDVIHGQHHLQAMAAMVRHPDAPAIFVCHGWLPWQEAPPVFPTLRRYIAVDVLRRDRIVLEHGVPADRVEIQENFVDTDRFAFRGVRGERPLRALLFSNQAGDNTLSDTVADVCAARGISLEIIGLRSGRPVRRPEKLLKDFDLVFARGRAALEAMATGASVVLCDVEGDGPLVTSENFEALRSLNFGMGALRRPLDAARLAAAVDRYDSEQQERVADLVRSRCSLEEAVTRLVSTYEDVIAEHRAAGAGPGDLAARDVSAYLEWLGPFIEQQINDQLTEATRSAQELLAHAVQRSMRAARLLENMTASSPGTRSSDGAQLLAGEFRKAAETDTAVVELQRALVETRSELTRLQKSPFVRARNALLSFGPLVAAYRFLIRRKTTDE